MEVERVDGDEWERALPDAGFEVFHTREALEVVARHVPGELFLLAGYKGDRPVGLFPLVVEERSVGRAVLSPPPSMGIPRLGPLLMPASPKRRKQERLNRKFTREVLSRFDVDRRATLLRVICSPTYGDPRPFTWDGLDVGPSFTYTLDTEGRTTDELLSSFSKSLRREIRDAREVDLAIEVEGPEAARAIHEQTRARYEEQGESYGLDWEYVGDLTEALAETDRCRTYVARAPDGEFVSGITVLYSNDAGYFWQGGARGTDEDVSVNSLLHWRIVEDVVEDPPRESVTQYDLMGANTERLCQYKSKFGADLDPYYVVESGGAEMALAKRAYRALAAFW